MNVRLEVESEKQLYYAILPEFQERGDRSAVRLEYRDGKLVAIVTAKDIVALQASINAIIKLIRVYDKARGV